jgi:hypothetical protein
MKKNAPDRLRVAGVIADGIWRANLTRAITTKIQIHHPSIPSKDFDCERFFITPLLELIIISIQTISNCKSSHIGKSRESREHF